MAGGPTTVALAAAVAAAGGFPFLAGGYKTPEALAAEIEQLRALDVPFGVNLFVPSRHPTDTAAFGAYAAELAPEAEAYGLRLDPVPVVDDDHWAEKLRMLGRDPVPVVSLTFGLPERGDVEALRGAGVSVAATVTSPPEAVEARALGVDGLVVQGSDAGGHSAIFDPTRDPEPVDTAELVRAVAAAVAGLPLIAAGGVDGPEAVRALRDAGAQAVAVGTLLLRTDEAGTSEPHRAAPVDPSFDRTVVTRAFTGRPARALRNGFVDRHGRSAPTAYPAVHHLTRALRQAASKAGDTDRMHLWAGTGHRLARTGPAADVVRGLAARW